MCNNLKNASKEELMEEISRRIDKGEITWSFTYYYDSEIIKTSIIHGDFKIGLTNSWDVKRSTRYRENYETFCLPIISQQEAKEYNDKIKKIWQINKN